MRVKGSPDFYFILGGQKFDTWAHHFFFCNNHTVSGPWIPRSITHADGETVQIGQMVNLRRGSLPSNLTETLIWKFKFVWLLLLFHSKEFFSYCFIWPHLIWSFRNFQFIVLRALNIAYPVEFWRAQCSIANRSHSKHGTALELTHLATPISLSVSL